MILPFPIGLFAGGAVQSFSFIKSITVTVQPVDVASFELAMPAYRPNGDLYLAIIASDLDFFANLAGWNTVNGAQGFLALMRIGSAEPASYTVTRNFGAPSAQHVGVVMRLSGHDPDGFGSGVPIGAGLSGGSVSNAPGFDSVTTGENDELVILAASSDGHAAVPSYAPTGFAPLLEQSSSLDDGACLLQLAAKIYPAAGAQDAVKFSISESKAWSAGIYLLETP